MTREINLKTVISLAIINSIMSLIQSAKMNGHDLLYLKDVQLQLQTQKNYLIHELLSHNWQP